MLGKSITFKTLLRIAGVLCSLWVLYRGFSIATMPVTVVNSDSPQQSFYLIQTDWLIALFLMAHESLHWFLAAAVLLLSFSFERIRVAYWGLQVSLWIVGTGIWYLVNNTFDPWPQAPMWLLITIVCSIVLLVLYKPITFLLTKMMRPHVLVKAQVKDEQFEEYELQVQRHINKDD
jgi:hypothetical protein